MNNDTILKWFLEHYEIVTDADAFVTCADIYETFRQSEFYECLSKKARREDYTKKGLKIQDNIKLKVKLYFHERKKINGVDYYSVLTHCKLKEEEGNK